MSVINNNNQIENGLRADIMRKAMETKALLSAKGSIYVGTGESETVGGEALPKTKALTIGGNGDFLKVVNGDLAYGKIDNSDFAPDVQLSNIWAGRATSADSAVSATNAGHATTADNATSATNAGHATTADSAASATHAVNADSATDATYASSDHTKGTIDDRIDAISSPYERVGVKVKNYTFKYGVSYLVVIKPDGNYSISYAYATTTEGVEIDSSTKYYGVFYFQHTCRHYDVIQQSGQVQFDLIKGNYYRIALGGELISKSAAFSFDKPGVQISNTIDIKLVCTNGTMDVYEFKN